MALLIQHRSDINPAEIATRTIWVAYAVSDDPTQDGPPEGVLWHRVDVTEAEENPTLAPVEKVAELGTAVPVAQRGRSQPARPARAQVRQDRPDNIHRQVREWCRKNGVQVHDRGRIPPATMAQYEAAMAAKGKPAGTPPGGGTPPATPAARAIPAAAFAAPKPRSGGKQ